MRSLLLAGAAALLIAGAPPAEARGGRFSGFRSHPAPLRVAEPGRARPDGTSLGGLSLRLGPTPGPQAAPVVAPLPERPAVAAVTPVPVAAPVAAPVATPLPVREARAREPHCPTGRLVGGSQDPASGFCLIN
ncbi:hypothetical protein [Methylobacterium segetis]|uniref:hypothetical protein n=1 Tax=Methylobacterium segetis TaxID=2488750 RepID=UPI0010436F58|nr:hypothetical protein [Methylobacterium segetis]